jgi:hypothetical protein
MTRALKVAATAILLLGASPALAHHIAGTIACDVDLDGTFSPGDTPLSGIDVHITSQDVSPGELFTGTTDGSGNYNVGLPARTDHYLVALANLPGTFTIVIPGGGTYLVLIVTGNSNTDHRDDVDFLVQGCGPVTTTTSTSTTTPSTKPSTTTTSTIATTSTTSTTSSTTTTVPVVCTCPGVPFLVAREGKINNDADVRASAGASNPGGRFRLGKNVVFADGTNLIGDTVQIGNGSSVFRVLANTLLQGDFVTIRGGTGSPSLPLAQPFCTVPAIACGGAEVAVKPGESVGPLAPGTYGKLSVQNGSTLTLAAGTFTFCDIKMGRNASLTTLGTATLNVQRNVVVGTASTFGPAVGDTPIVVNVAGKLVRVSQSAVANAAFFAPAGRITFGRDSHLLGCFCTDREKSDKHITLECREP